MTAEEKKAILHVLGDIPEDVYDELVSEMLAQARGAVPRMRDAAGRGDYPALKALSHSIKGAAANLRRRSIADAAAGLEKMAVNGAAAELVLGGIDEFGRLLTAE